ncbi:hypothetical protein [Magnetofaba australis]|uniref:Transmembrane protein n=1 Tax=Magnetofaba australis IT-1 TaxID=1434232 RepID=A0A1Y2K662_9PROT|nr:hypothetical protein [Magnetofaba australis]OSM05174.1 hypothetical protein MAIT1_03331 [Magnetofaba australis IT-1]
MDNLGCSAKAHSASSPPATGWTFALNWAVPLVALAVLACSLWLYQIKRDSLSFDDIDYLPTHLRIIGDDHRPLHVNTNGNSMLGFFAIEGHPVNDDSGSLHLSPAIHLLPYVYRWGGGEAGLLVFYFLLNVGVLWWMGQRLIALTRDVATGRLFVLVGLLLPSFMPLMLYEFGPFVGWVPAALLFLTAFEWRPQLKWLLPLSAFGLLWREDFTVFMLIAAFILALRDRPRESLVLAIPATLYMVYAFHHDSQVAAATLLFPSRPLFLLAIAGGVFFTAWAAHRPLFDGLRRWDAAHRGVMELLFIAPFLLYYVAGIPSAIKADKTDLSNVVAVIKYVLRSLLIEERYFLVFLWMLFLWLAFGPVWKRVRAAGWSARSRRVALGFLTVLVVWCWLDTRNDLRRWSERVGLRDRMLALEPALAAAPNLTALDLKTNMALFRLQRAFAWERLPAYWDASFHRMYPESAPRLKQLFATEVGQYAITTHSYRMLQPLWQEAGIAERIEVCEQTDIWTIARHVDLGVCP